MKDARMILYEQCVCVHKGWGYHDWRGGGAWISFLICDHLAPPGSCWPEPSRAAPVPRGIYGEVTTAAGDTVSPNTLKQSAQMIAHTHMLIDEEIRCMEVSEMM